MSSTRRSPLGCSAISFFWTNCWLHLVVRPRGTEQRPRQLSELEIIRDQCQFCLLHLLLKLTCTLQI